VKEGLGDKGEMGLGESELWRQEKMGLGKMRLGDLRKMGLV